MAGEALESRLGIEGGRLVLDGGERGFSSLSIVWSQSHEIILVFPVTFRAQGHGGGS